MNVVEVLIIPDLSVVHRQRVNSEQYSCSPLEYERKGLEAGRTRGPVTTTLRGHVSKAACKDALKSFILSSNNHLEMYEGYLRTLMIVLTREVQYLSLSSHQLA